MKEIVIILILILVLYLTIKHKNNYPKSGLNLITKDKAKKIRQNKNDYYTRPVKKVRFADEPEYMKCPYGRTSYTNEPKDDVFVVKDAIIPAGSSLEVMSGNRIVLQYYTSVTAGDILRAYSDTATSLDVIVSYLEIT